MILLKSKVLFTDNSSAKKGECIKVLGGSKKVAKIGDTVVVSLQSVATKIRTKTRSSKDLPKGSVQKAILLRTRKEMRRRDGTRIRFGQNGFTLLKKDGQPISTRIFGPLVEELRLVKEMRLLSLGSSII
jgi:large subunit ribosomal protein L14